MHDMPLAVYHDVAVVSVFDLQYIAGDRIRSHRLDKVETRFLKCDCILPSVFCDEEVKEIIDFRSSHFIPRCRVRNHIDYAALRSN